MATGCAYSWTSLLFLSAPFGKLITLVVYLFEHCKQQKTAGICIPKQGVIRVPHELFLLSLFSHYTQKVFVVQTNQ